MVRRTIALSGWIVALLVIAGASLVHSQAPFQQGAFVRAGDGSIWVVSNGVRYGINAAADDAGVVSGLPQGTAVSTAAELAAVLAAASAPAAPPPPPPDPAQTLIGQRATICPYEIPIEIEVVRTEWVKSVIGVNAPGNAMWAMAIINVTNLGTTSSGLYSAATIEVRDQRNRQLRAAEYPPDPIDLHRSYGVKGAYELFLPNITEESIAVFAVPPDAQSLTLVATMPNNTTSGRTSCQ